MYDPQLGRWHVMDPLTEIASSITPYRYAFNNPIRFTDVFGLWERDKKGNYHTTDYNDILNLVQQIKSGNGGSSLVNFVEKSYNDQVKFEASVKSGAYGKCINELNVEGKGSPDKVSLKDTRTDYDYLFTDANDSRKNPYIWTPEEMDRGAKITYGIIGSTLLAPVAVELAPIAVETLPMVGAKYGSIALNLGRSALGVAADEILTAKESAELIQAYLASNPAVASLVTNYLKGYLLENPPPGLPGTPVPGAKGYDALYQFISILNKYSQELNTKK